MKNDKQFKNSKITLLLKKDENSGFIKNFNRKNFLSDLHKKHLK